ncbi:MAG: type II toxin-antitoxin system RelE/ParE family toxin [Blastocatellia bacterium]
MTDTTGRNIKIYKTAKGQSPFKEWIKSLTDGATVDVINSRITRIRGGLFGDCKAVGEGVYELRIDYGPGYRVYFGQEGTELVLLLCGGNKSSQKQDIKDAKAYWDNYKSKS